MPYEFLDDGVTSDVTFHAWGRSLEELFAAAADATLNVMVRSVESVRPLETRSVSVDADELDLLLKRFLDELIYRKDVEELLLRATEVHEYYLQPTIEFPNVPPAHVLDLLGRVLEVDLVEATRSEERRRALGPGEEVGVVRRGAAGRCHPP